MDMLHLLLEYIYLLYFIDFSPSIEFESLFFIFPCLAKFFLVIIASLMLSAEPRIRRRGESVASNTTADTADVDVDPEILINDLEVSDSPNMKLRKKIVS